MDAADTPLGHLWAVHSSKEERPALRAWAPSQAEAEALMRSLQQEDSPADDRYWTTQLTEHQIESLKQTGFIPKEA